MDKNKFLIKLKRYSINEIIKFSTFYSLYSASTNYSFDINLKSEIFTWEIDSLLLMKLYVGQTSGNVSSLTQDKFVELINYIKNRDFSEEFLIQGRDILDFLPIVAANQFTNQIENRILMYRSIYFFRLSSNDLLRVAFESKFGISIIDAQQTLMTIYHLAVIYKNNLAEFNILFSKLLENENAKNVVKVFSLSVDSAQELLNSNHCDPMELIYRNYYLKSYCFLESENVTYITYPHNIIITIAYGLIYRLTEGDADLRAKFGKEILEKYLEHLCHISGKFDGVETERKYFINKNKLLTPDILVFKEDKCLFIESKSSVIKSSFRDINNLSSEMYYINLYSENLFKLYKHIKNYRNEVFNIFDRRFDNDNCYGVLVNYEDVQISRTKIFDEFFNLIQSESIQINGKEKIWIYNHLRIIDMYEFEKLLLFKIENNFIAKMFENDHSDQTYSFVKEELFLNSEVINKVSSVFKDSKEIVSKLLFDM